MSGAPRGDTPEGDAPRGDAPVGDDREAEARRKEREDRKAALAWAGTLGVLGWMLAVPMLAGAALGHWIDGKLHSAPAATLGLLLAGLVVGGGSAWRWIKRRMEDEKKS
ncbi:MAG TPA: AtpZ/AtpI family protein [Rectinemataceae bacterium]|nr:AtpZ/AtpI family protein [Rectinemataceae bacterium]